MNQIKSVKNLVAIIVSSLLLSGTALADNSAASQVRGAASDLGEKVDRSLDKVGDYVDDSAITTRVKLALIDVDAIRGNDLSVTTEKGVVMLEGSAESRERTERAIGLAKAVKGVKAVNYKFLFKDTNRVMLEGSTSNSASPATDAKPKSSGADTKSAPGVTEKSMPPASVAKPEPPRVVEKPVSQGSGKKSMSGSSAHKSMSHKSGGQSKLFSASDKTMINGYTEDGAVSEIKAKLRADDIVPSREIQVTTFDGKVQLTGTMNSERQLKRAIGLAEAVTGSGKVDNHLTVKK